MFDQSDKMRVGLTITLYGKTHSMNCEYDDSELWSDVLRDVVKTLEASYGYSFDLEDLGIYYQGKDDGSE